MGIKYKQDGSIDERYLTKNEKSWLNQMRSNSARNTGSYNGYSGGGYRGGCFTIIIIIVVIAIAVAFFI